jgi:hypothetical protein
MHYLLPNVVLVAMVQLESNMEPFILIVTVAIIVSIIDIEDLTKLYHKHKKDD